MDVSQFVKALSDLAEKSPEARAFISVFMLELILLVAFVTYFLKRFVDRRQRLNEASDEDVTPKDNTISVLTQILAKTADNAARLSDRVEQIEAQNAGVMGKLETVIQVDKQFLEALASLTVASEQLLKVAGGIRTRAEAAADAAETLALVKAEIAPVLATTAKALDQATVNGATTSAIDTKADELLAKVDALPPHLDALKVKIDNLPPIIIQSFNSLIAERDEARKQTNAEREMKEQACARADLLTSQNAAMTADAMAKDKTIDDLREQLRIARATIEAGLKPAPEPPPVADHPAGGAA